MVKEVDAVKLLSPVSEAEIKETMFSIDSDRAPGPDGFNSHFYKASWDIVGSEIIAAIKEFFSIVKLLKQPNDTSLTIIPKMENAEELGDFRPFSCCNVLYKCITKVITRRLFPILQYVISANQSGFVKGISIADNVMLAHELVRNYHR